MPLSFRYSQLGVIVFWIASGKILLAFDWPVGSSPFFIFRRSFVYPRSVFLVSSVIFLRRPQYSHCYCGNIVHAWLFSSGVRRMQNNLYFQLAWRQWKVQTSQALMDRHRELDPRTSVCNKLRPKLMKSSVSWRFVLSLLNKLALYSFGLGQRGEGPGAWPKAFAAWWSCRCFAGMRIVYS